MDRNKEDEDLKREIRKFYGRESSEEKESSGEFNEEALNKARSIIDAKREEQERQRRASDKR